MSGDDPGALLLLGSIAKLLNAGLGIEPTLAAVTEALRAGIHAHSVTLWFRGPGATAFRAVSAPVAPRWETSLDSLDAVPHEPSLHRFVLEQEGIRLGLLTARLDGGDAGLGVLQIVADFLTPYVASAELSTDLAGEVAAQSREIEEHRRFTSLIIDTLPLGLYVVDRDYRIQTWNRKRETGTQGLRREVVVGRRIFDVLTRQDPERLRTELDRVFQTGEIQQGTLEVGVGEESRFYRLSKIPMRLDGDEITHVITIGEDVTDWHGIQARIMQSEKLAAIGQLAAGVMHEINNPLATISACVAAIQGRIEPLSSPVASAVGEYLEIIDKEVDRCSAIVDGLLDFSRPKSKAKTAGGDGCALAAQAPPAVQTLPSRGAARSGAALAHRKRRAADPGAHGPHAERHGRDGARRPAHAAHQPRSASLRRNRAGGAGHRHRNRPGRAGQDLRAVLHHQAARPRHRSRALHLLWDRGGPSRPDRGRQRARSGRHLPGAPPRAPGMKILVVEDDRTVGQYVKRGLEEQGYHADLVDDGMEGLRLASGGRYDLIVLDLRLPGMSGLEVLRTLRDRGTTTPILVLTAQDAVDFKVQALRSGADDYVTKPFAFEELLARVEALGRRPKEIRDPLLRVGDLELDSATREVRRAGAPIDLTPKEYTVLEYLMRHAGRVMSRTLITEYAWDYHFDPGTNIVDVVINRLRKKVDSGQAQKLVHTVRGVGYVVKA